MIKEDCVMLAVFNILFFSRHPTAMADKTYSFQGSSFSDHCCKQSTRRVSLYTNLIGINVIIIIIVQ